MCLILIPVLFSNGFSNFAMTAFSSVPNGALANWSVTPFERPPRTVAYENARPRRGLAGKSSGSRHREPDDCGLLEEVAPGRARLIPVDRQRFVAAIIQVVHSVLPPPSDLARYPGRTTHIRAIQSEPGKHLVQPS